MGNVGRDYPACAAARRQGVYGSTRGIRRQALDRLILDAFVEEWNRAMAEAGTDRDGLVRELARVERKLQGLIEAVSDGFRVAGLATAAPTQPHLHPALPELYRAKVADLVSALDGEDGAVTRDSVRSLIEHITLHPEADSHCIEVCGELTAIVGLAASGSANDKGPGVSAEASSLASQVKMVTGTRNQLDLLLTGRTSSGSPPRATTGWPAPVTPCTCPPSSCGGCRSGA